MPIQSLHEILSNARREAYGVPYCESWNLESAQAVVAAAERLGSPAIVGFNGGFLQHRSRPYPEKLAWYAGLRMALESARVPVAPTRQYRHRPALQPTCPTSSRDSGNTAVWP